MSVSRGRVKSKWGLVILKATHTECNNTNSFPLFRRVVTLLTNGERISIFIELLPLFFDCFFHCIEPLSISQFPNSPERQWQNIGNYKAAFAHNRVRDKLRF